MNIEVSRITSKGQITTPKAIRERLRLAEGDKLAFIEEDSGKIVITKSTTVALRKFLDTISEEATAKNLTEEQLLADLEQVRKEMWDERKN